jgi:hypothetical protein
MSASSGSHNSRGKRTITTVKLSKTDHLFLLSWRGVVAKNTDTLAKLVEMLGPISQTEQRALNNFNAEDREFTNSLAQQGWFHKTYESVKHYVKNYLKENYTEFPEYNYPPHPTISEMQSLNVKASLITKLLKFYHLKGIDIPLVSIRLTDEQLSVVSPPIDTKQPAAPAQSTNDSLQEIIMAVNSGAGTGKTTAAIHKAKQLMDEHVICVAFTREAASHFKRSLQSIVDDIDYVNDKIRHSDDATSKPPKIYVATIDSLAANFATMPASLSPDSEEFDMRIVQATNNLERNDKFFFTKDGFNVFNHIIVDEAQDLSEERYNFIMGIFRIICQNANTSLGGDNVPVLHGTDNNGDPGSGVRDVLDDSSVSADVHSTVSATADTGVIAGKTRKVKNSITFFGDPRQRISGKGGQQFQRMLASTDPNIVKKCFTKSFRFQNANLLRICNELSSVRPDIHIPLESAIQHTIDTKVQVFSRFEDVAETIITLIKEHRVLPHQICIITPAPRQGHCKATREVRDIVNILASQNIVSSKLWKEDAVLYTSIHAVKGLEFDYVFFAGATNFPEPYREVYPVNDATSLNFVANTRARKMMYYLSDKTFGIPQNVPATLTENGKTLRRYAVQYYPREAIRTEEIEERDYRKFEDTNTYHSTDADTSVRNEMKLNTNIVKQLDRTSNPYLYETISAVLSAVGGLTIPQNIDDVNIVAKKDYMGNKRLNILCDLCSSYMDDMTQLLEIKGVFIGKEQEELYQELMDAYPVEDITKHKQYNKLMKGGESELVNMSEINNNVMMLASLVRNEAIDKSNERPVMRTHHSVVGAKIKASCIVSETAILVFSSSYHLCSLVKRLNANRKVYSVSFSNFTVVEIVSAQYQPYRYSYYIDALYTITCQNLIIRTKAASDEFVKPTFFVDTEFLPIENNKRKTIYDIAVINGNDPYRSLVSLIDCGEETFGRIKSSVFGQSVPFDYTDIKGCPNIDQFFEKFCVILSGIPTGERPSLYYYNVAAKHDTAWITEHFGMDEDVGIDLLDAMKLVGKAKLDVNYDKITSSACANYKHIFRHTAVGDTVLLWEMVRMILHPLTTVDAV